MSICNKVIPNIIIICVLLWNCTNNNAQKPTSKPAVGMDSIFRCSESYEKMLIKEDKPKLVFYIEGDYCASCHAKIIYPLLSFLEDSIDGVYGKPFMFWHPRFPNNEMIELFQEFFGKECEFYFTKEDSIREKNIWMNPNINIYGFIIGPSNELLYAGFLYDKNFKVMTKKLYEKGFTDRIKP